MVPHTRGGRDRAKTQNAAQLLPDREPLLRRQDHTGMLPPGADPLRVKTIEIGNVVCIENTLTFRSESQLFLVGVLDKASVQRSQHRNTPRTKSRDQTIIHRVFVEVELDLIHRCESAAVLPFQSVSLAVLRLQVCVDLRLVGIVVGKCRMNLRQRQLASECLYNLFRNLTHVVPLSDPAN